MDYDLKLGLRAKDIGAEIAFGVGVGYCLLDDLDEVAILTAKIDKACLSTDRQAGDDGAFDDRVRIMQEDEVIFAGARAQIRRR